MISGSAIPEPGEGLAGEDGARAPLDSTEPGADPVNEEETIRVLESYLEQLDQGTPPQSREWLAEHFRKEGSLEDYLVLLDLLQETALKPCSALSPQAAPTAQEAVVEQLGDYRILREIGRGGMGVVYEAEQISLGRRVALKVLPLAGGLDPRQLQRFHNEALAAAQLQHPHIVDVFDAGCEQGVPYYAMRYIAGQTLAERIAALRRACGLEPAAEPDVVFRAGEDNGPVVPASAEPPTRTPAYFRWVAEIGAQVAGALDYAHEHGIVHRDIKPSNVILDTQGKPWVADFGLARLEQQACLTRTGDLVGTLRYMSREQALSKRAVLDHRTDIYAWGATVYELLTLEPAARGSDREEILRWLTFEEVARPSLLNRAIPPDLEAIVLKAMAKAPEDRYATAGEFAEDLRRFLNNQPVRARRPTWLRQAAKWAQRHRRPLLASGVLALLLLTVGVVLLALGNARIRQALTARDQALSDLRDQEEQTRTAERDKTLQLALSRWNEARVFRQSRQPGQRYRSLEGLTEAVRHLRSLDRLESHKLELRNDAIACLGLWDVREVKRLPLPWPAFRYAHFDSGGTHYAVCDGPNTATIRRVEDDRIVQGWSWQGGPCVSLFLSPDDRFLTALCRQQTQGEEAVCRVWDRVTGKLVQERKISPRCGHAFRPDSQVLALAQPDDSIMLCELSKGRDLPALPRGPTPHCLRFDPSGSLPGGVLLHAAGGAGLGPGRWQSREGIARRLGPGGQPGVEPGWYASGAWQPQFLHLSVRVPRGELPGGPPRPRKCGHGNRIPPLRPPPGFHEPR